MRKKKIPNKPFHSNLTYQPNQETAVAEILFLIIGESGGAAAFVGTATPTGESGTAGRSRAWGCGGWSRAHLARCPATPQVSCHPSGVLPPLCPSPVTPQHPAPRESMASVGGLWGQPWGAAGGDPSLGPSTVQGQVLLMGGREGAPAPGDMEMPPLLLYPWATHRSVLHCHRACRVACKGRGQGGMSPARKESRARALPGCARSREIGAPSAVGARDSFSF